MNYHKIIPSAFSFQLFLLFQLQSCPPSVKNSPPSLHKDFDQISCKPIIFNSEQGANVLKEYGWGGTGIAQFYGWGHQRIAEVWFNSTQKDGLTTLSSNAGTLLDVINKRQFNMLGSAYTSKPVFCKILGKDELAPQIVHSGFNSSIEGNSETFINLCILERLLVVKLQLQLSHLIQKADEFQCYKNAYDNWTSQEIRCQWHDTTLLPTLPPFMIDFQTSIFDQLRSVREKLVSYLNEIHLQEGLVVLSPVGNIHSIVGSHQMHPPADHNEAKNEAYYIFSAGRDENGKHLLLYFEPQQTSNTTYSPFDFACPIEFRNDKVIMRKDLTKGLDALLSNQDKHPATESDAIRLMLTRAIDFRPTRTQDLIINDKIKDITNSTRYSNATNCKAESIIEGTYPPAWAKNYFTVERIIFNGGNQWASIQVRPLQDLYHELFIIEGTVDMLYSTTLKTLPQGSSVFVPAAYQDTYELKSIGTSQALRVYPG